MSSSEPVTADSKEDQGSIFDNPFISFAPMIIFSFLAGPGRFELGALLALAVALLLIVASVVRGRSLKLLNLLQALIFAVLAVLGLVVGEATLTWLEDWANNGSWLIFGLIMLTTVVIGVPCTEQYAKESTPPEVWSSPLFKRINRTLSLVWAAAMLAAGAVAVIGQAVTGSGDQNTWTEWIIPIACIVLALKFTAQYPDKARQEYADRQGAQPV